MRWVDAERVRRHIEEEDPVSEVRVQGRRGPDAEKTYIVSVPFLTPSAPGIGDKMRKLEDCCARKGVLEIDHGRAVISFR